MPEPTRARRTSAQVEAEILTATLELVGERGYAGLVVDAVAQRAGAARTVIYRRWPDKPHLVAAALDHAKAGLVPEAPSGDLREDLRTVLHNVADLLGGPLGAACAALHADRGAQPAVRAAADAAGLSSRGLAVERVLQRAVEAGELDPAVLTSQVGQSGTALMLYHLADGRRRVDRELADELLEDVVWPGVARFRR